MFQRDYILRMIEAAAQAIARALRLLIAKRPEEAEQQLSEGYAALSIDLELLLFLDGPSVRSYFGDDDKLAMAVRLLLCDSEIQWAKSDARAALRRLKAARRLLAQHPAPEAELTRELGRVTQLIEGA